MIRSRPCPDCYLCQSPGKALYTGLKDRLYNVAGAWDVKQCPDPVCGLIWLDPLPLKEDIGEAYRDYMTHDRPGSERGGLFGALIDVYETVNHCIYGIIGFIRKQGRVEELYLNSLRPGRLLEIGCGAGELLNHLRSLGWEVEGVEPDAQVVGQARRKYGLNIHSGDLASLDFTGENFDVIVINHVIEHLHDPRKILRECHRILKRGGSLVIVTPNTKSLAHRLFQNNWLWLDPPRHLHLFSQANLGRCARSSGFEKAKVWSTSVHAMRVFVGSMDIRRFGSHKLHAKTKVWHYFSSLFLQLLELTLIQLGFSVGEEIVLLAVNE